MADIDRIKNFTECMERQISDFKRGYVVCNYQMGPSDGSIPRAEARYMHARFGAIRDPDLAAGRWQVDWTEGDKPTLRLSADLFAHVADARESA